ncbi:MAG: hypothetical protein ABW360_15455, partial [Phenylobacterium sp.]
MNLAKRALLLLSLLMASVAAWLVGWRDDVPVEVGRLLFTGGIAGFIGHEILTRREAPDAYSVAVVNIRYALGAVAGLSVAAMSVVVLSDDYVAARRAVILATLAVL